MIMQLAKEQQTWNVTSLAPCLGQMCLGVEQGGRSRTGCVEFYPVQLKEHRRISLGSQIHSSRVSASYPVLGGGSSAPKQTSSHQTSVLGLSFIFSMLVSHFQVLLPSNKRFPFCHSLLALFLVVYQPCRLPPLLVLFLRLFLLVFL